jgi:hypothetical protein
VWHLVGLPSRAAKVVLEMIVGAVQARGGIDGGLSAPPSQGIMAPAIGSRQ